MYIFKHLLNKKGSHLYQSFAWFFNRIVAQMIFQQKYEYKDVYPFFAHKEADKKEYVIPTLIPNFDHSPRSKMNGYILNNSNPKYFKKLCELIFDNVKCKENKLVWLRSWNEWGEGNYMEPDLTFGHGYINAIKEALNEKE